MVCVPEAVRAGRAPLSRRSSASPTLSPPPGSTARSACIISPMKGYGGGTFST
jgi:hypothetical protein